VQPVNKEKTVYIIYGITKCRSCDKAKALLTEKGLQFEFINLDLNPEHFHVIQDLGTRTVPQVFDENGEHIGGYEDLHKTF
jgi:glutaredoxin